MATRPDASFANWQFAALNNPYDHFAMFAGVATGKTYTGAHWSIDHFDAMPQNTGFIGANTYDQLSQATLRELLFWLDHYGYEWVIDKAPPAVWGGKKRFKSYSNILSVLIDGVIAHAFTRVLSNWDALRGVEFSWYWLDETRDTPQDAHDVILSRMRESAYARGLITTTTNGEDWAYRRFVLGNDGSGLYGSMHVPTIRSVEAGIITRAYYDTMLKSYSPLLAEQELEAKHVNVKGGRAYYAFSELNRKRRAPWGDRFPNPDRPLIIGCDFNFQPAPCVWMVGQVGPEFYGPSGEYFPECVHWFGEISDTEISTRQMALRVLSQYPGFFYEIYGDMSGNQGTTSNAGETDFHQIGEELADAGALYSIAVEQVDAKQVKTNPRVRNRVENMNARARNALGEIRQTYNPEACPLFDGDVRMVGWKPNVLQGRGKLDDGGDKQRTHASDGAGYAIWRKFPPGRRATIVGGHTSPFRAHNSVLDVAPRG